MNKTNEEVLEFLGVAEVWLQKNQDDSKFCYAVDKVAKDARSVKKHMEHLINDINVKHAIEDGTPKKLLRNERGEYEYTKNGMLARNKDARELLEQTTEITPHFAEAPEGLRQDLRDAFTGFVIKEGTNGTTE